jgi:phytoene desaturase
MARDVIVIGAGPGGLASAMLLAGAGCRVRMFERHARVGGRTSAIEADGFRFDVGPTFFLYPHVLRSIFKSVGRKLEREIEMIKLDPQYRVMFGSGGEMMATPDIERMKAEVAKISPRDAASIDRFMSENRAKLALFKPCLETSFLSLRDVLSLRMLKMLPTLRPWNSLDRELGRYFHDERIRLAFSFQSKYLGMSPYKCPSLFSILSFLEYEHGVFHPIGGCSAVSETMNRIAVEMGVETHLSEPIEKIIFEGRQAVGVKTSEGTYRADAVVINADFAGTVSKLIPNALRPKWTDAKLARKEYSCSTFMLYLGVEGRDELAHHTIYLAPDYQQNLRDIQDRHVLTEDPSIYVQNACVTDPRLAPAGKSTLYVLVPVTHQHPNVDWKKEAARYRQIALNQLPKLGFRDVEKRIVYEKMVTPDDWARFGPIYRGATFNLAHNLGQMLHLRPKNRFEGTEGVYLVGGGTHPGSGLPVIFESARITSRLLLEDFGIRSNVAAMPAEYDEMTPALAGHTSA